MPQGTTLTLTAWGWKVISLMAGYSKLFIIGSITYSALSGTGYWTNGLFI